MQTYKQVTMLQMQLLLCCLYSDTSESYFCTSFGHKQTISDSNWYINTCPYDFIKLVTSKLRQKIFVQPNTFQFRPYLLMPMGVKQVKGNRDITKCRKQSVTSKKSLLEPSNFHVHIQLHKSLLTHSQQRMSSFWTHR